MHFFRHKVDRVPVALIVLLFLLDVLVYFRVQSTLALVGWALLALLGKNFAAAWNHHHQHVPTFRQTALNRLLEIVYMFHTGISTNVWVLHHNLGHHLNYLDQEKDESGWKRKDGKTMGVYEYTATIALTGYPRAWRVGRKHPKFQQGLIGMGIVNLVLLAMLLAYNPLNALIVFVVPMILVYIGTCWCTYYHHADLDTDDPLHASHNVTNRLYNILTGNLGYHTAHHMKQALHWSKLPELHRQIEHKIPAHLITEEYPAIAPLYSKSSGSSGSDDSTSPALREA
ncbi:MAG: fatty acid desaturase [Deltaproteobacteria bacterium]|nr:fatty acid desaturase [Deltaproteobacteria bacterium]